MVFSSCFGARSYSRRICRCLSRLSSREGRRRGENGPPRPARKKNGPGCAGEGHAGCSSSHLAGKQAEARGSETGRARPGFREAEASPRRERKGEGGAVSRPSRCARGEKRSPPGGTREEGRFREKRGGEAQ